MNRTVCFNFVIGLSGVVCASSVVAACYVATNAQCCDILAGAAPNADNGLSTCRDQITVDSSVPHYTQPTSGGAAGRSKLTVQEPGSTCTWDNYIINAQENCVYVNTQSNTCKPSIPSGTGCNVPA